ncbi:MAG: hypothetical protein Q4Q58_01105 [Thermoplasmata archaeon]|nr:hypothetical protein [Thermoplasmata archaeon]
MSDMVSYRFLSLVVMNPGSKMKPCRLYSSASMDRTESMNSSKLSDDSAESLRKTTGYAFLNSLYS